VLGILFDTDPTSHELDLMHTINDHISASDLGVTDRYNLTSDVLPEEIDGTVRNGETIRNGTTRILEATKEGNRV